MKVINTWDGEPARTPTQIIRDWYAEYKDEMHRGGIDGFHATELMAALASRKDQEMNSRCADCNCEDCRCDRPPMPAANQWRYDVKNAPHDWVAVWHKEHPRDWFKARLSIEGYWETARYERTITPDAFATINRPETTHDNP